MMRIVLIALLALASTGCTVYNAGYPGYPYADPWPVRVPVYPQVVVQQPVIVQQPPVVIQQQVVPVR